METVIETVNFIATRVIVTSKKSFEEVTNKIETINGKSDSTVFQQMIVAKQSFEQIKSGIESMIGQSGFMIFSQVEHGKLMSLVGKNKKAKLYIIGNPLIANQMFEQNPAVGLYVPLRLFVYDDYNGKTHVAYDKPSSLLSQFPNEKISTIMQMLDQKFEEMIRIVT
ncbi:DUF302 domain-containing protein [Nostoc sp.]|uniref:DUF302 domain-containing protein n=1 Tax=Nostoc sp. TaxID=1180 RepID=UPI002FF36D16